MTTRISIPLIGGNQWRGGRNFMMNLLRSLDELGSGQVEPVLFLGEDDDLGDDLGSIDSIKVIRHSSFDLRRKKSRLAKALITGIDAGAAREFAIAGIDCAFETAQFYGWRFPLPVLAWIPDFQHRHMPELFSKAAWWKRDLGFQAQVASGRQIMLSSEDARQDCERFYPKSKGHTSVVSFATQIPECPDHAKIMQVRAKYHLPARFVFLPNQFWIHKDHEVVIRALDRLRSNGSSICVVATGHPHDPRSPGHFSRLTQLVNDMDLQREFRMLGSVPFEDVQALLHGCTALLNPSRFEGWSTTVEEGKAADVQMILSDLAVHREQAGDRALYFKTGSSDELAAVLGRLTPNVRAPRTDPEMLSTQRRKAFVGAFEHAVLTAVRTKD